MKRFHIFSFAAALVFGASIILNGCKDEDNPAKPGDENPQEVITTVILSLVDSANSSSTVTAAWNDKDGTGGGVPNIDTLRLAVGKTYAGTIEVYDSTKSDHEEQHVTHEIEEESDVHQFFYTPQGALVGRVTVEKTDKDINNLPIGLQYKVRVSASAAVGTVGSIRVVLSHYDGVPKTTTPSDESDIDIDIPVKLQ